MNLNVDMKKLMLSALVGVALSSNAVWAQETPSPWKWVGTLGVSFGGDTLAKGTYSNTGDGFTIKAGSGLLMAIGGAYQVAPQWTVQSTIGYHFDSTNAKNGDVEFSRMPVELLGLYSLNDAWRVGAGVRSAGSAKLKSSGAAAGLGDYSFSNSIGQILEAQYFFGANQEGVERKFRMALAGRIVKEDFTAKVTNKSVSGNHFGLNLMVYY
jgi:hypothetical protein